MADNGDELEGEGQAEEEILESESEAEDDDAILHEQKDSSSPRDNI